jgi:hypothetical protein
LICARCIQGQAKHQDHHDRKSSFRHRFTPLL